MPRSGGGGMGGGMGGGGFGGGGIGGGGHVGGGGGRSGGRSGGGMGGAPRGGMGGAPRGGGMRGGGSGIGGFTAGMLLGNMMTRSGGGGGGAPNNGNNGGGGGGCMSGCIIAVIAIILIAIILAFFSGIGSCISDSFDDSSSSIPASTETREKLDLGSVSAQGYYTDESGDWISSASTLESGMKTFYNRTGVQPYLYILPNGAETSSSQLNSTAEELYSTLFGNEDGHFLFVFCDDGYGGFYYGYYEGNSVYTVMDDNAIDIFVAYLARYYDTADTEDEMFSNAYSKTAERIMGTPASEYIVPIVICIVIVIVAVLIFITLRRRREQRERESQRVEEILKTPLERYDDPVENLANEYESGNADTSGAKSKANTTSSKSTTTTTSASDGSVKTSSTVKTTSETTAQSASATSQATAAQAVETPEKEYGDTDVEDLAKKYEDKNGESQTGDE